MLVKRAQCQEEICQKSSVQKKVCQDVNEQKNYACQTQLNLYIIYSFPTISTPTYTCEFALKSSCYTQFFHCFLHHLRWFVNNDKEAAVDLLNCWV